MNTKHFVIMPSMKTYADRLTHALEQRDVNQTELAHGIGVKPQNIQYLCKKGKSSRHTNKIAKFLRINPTWLDQGTGQWDDPDEPDYPPNQHKGMVKMVKEPDITIYKIPLISWRDAISWPDLDDKERGNLVDMEVLTTRLTSKNAFAVEVLNDDYTNPPGQVSIQRGERLIVDPSVEPQHGYIVIAKFKDQDLPTPMIYQIVGGRKYLKPIKTEYPPIPLDDSVILRGTVVCGEKSYLGT